MPEGELAIVLHTHMPYVEGGGEWPPSRVRDYMKINGCDFAAAVRQASFEPNLEGFGTWPFGEEWLWEAIAGSYVPLLEVFDERGAEWTRQHLTLSITPVLADQLEAPGAIGRCIEFIRGFRAQTHQLDRDELAGRGESTAVAELERSAVEYAQAADTLERLNKGPGLLGALGAHATWTSAATHPILPLLVLQESIDLQLRAGVESHRHRFGGWGGGLWLPECAHAPWLNSMLAEAGVRAGCVELTNLLGPGSSAHLTPIQTDEGPVLVPIDRETIDLVWGTGGYPSNGPYRSYNRLTTHDHRVHANDGSSYDHARAAAQARADAALFVAAVRQRIADGGLCVCAVDTELLGHWWFEGPQWLRAVIDEAARQGLPLCALDEATLDRHSPQASPPGGDNAITSWGEGNDLRTWSGPAAAALAWEARTAELETFADTPSPRALRELFALQSSDWAFMVSRGWAGEYPRQRASGHAAQLKLALDGRLDDPRLRNLMPGLS